MFAIPTPVLHKLLFFKCFWKYVVLQRAYFFGGGGGGGQSAIRAMSDKQMYRVLPSDTVFRCIHSNTIITS